MEDNNDGWSVQVQGEPDLHVSAVLVKAMPEYFDSVGTRVVMGRGIGMQDTATLRPVAVVNQAFVKKLFKPGENPIGHHFGDVAGTAGDYEIVGVVEDTAYTDAALEVPPDVLRAHVAAAAERQGCRSKKTNSLYAGAIVLKTDRPMNDMEAIAQRNAFGDQSQSQCREVSNFRRADCRLFHRGPMLARLTALFGGLALLLATIGLYGVTRLYGGTADGGDRDSHGPRRRARQGHGHDPTQRGNPGRHRTGDRRSDGSTLRAVRSSAALRSERHRLSRACDIGAHVGTLRVRGWVPAGAARSFD